MSIHSYVVCLSNFVNFCTYLSFSAVYMTLKVIYCECVCFDSCVKKPLSLLAILSRTSWTLCRQMHWLRQHFFPNDHVSINWLSLLWLHIQCKSLRIILLHKLLFWFPPKIFLIFYALYNWYQASKITYVTEHAKRAQLTSNLIFVLSVWSQLNWKTTQITLTFLLLISNLFAKF